MIAWIQFKDEYMINARRTPAVCIDAKQEDKQDDEEHATVHAQCRMPVHHAVVHSTHTTFSREFRITTLHCSDTLYTGV